MNKIVGVATLGLVLLAGCATQDEPIDNQTDQMTNADQMEGMDGTATPIAGTDAELSALEQETLTAQQLLEEQDSAISSRTIYFEYDSARVSDDSMVLLEAHGDFIASNGNVNVTLTGHADERGSREYNIALGDRRALSVRRILLFQGASSDQIETVSYGEEQPAVMGHDEDAWSKNRRVELIYLVR